MKITFLAVLLCFSFIVFANQRKTILHPNGKVQYEYEMQGNMLDGKFSCYYETGKLMIKGQFSNNFKIGLWRVWDEKGLLRSERNYTGDQDFDILGEWDSSGNKILNFTEIKNNNTSCDFKDYLFSHRFISSIEKSDSANAALFSESGFIAGVLKDAMNGSVSLFSDHKLAHPINLASLSCYESNDVVGLLVKEEYFCCAAHQTMNNRLIAVCPVVMENGKRKELGWIYVPDISFEKDAINKLKNHQYTAVIIKTTVDDPAFKFRDVSVQENDSLRLMLEQFEANAILYTIDNSLAIN